MSERRQSLFKQKSEITNGGLVLHLLLLAFDKLLSNKLCDVSDVYEKSLLGDCQGGRKTCFQRTRGELPINAVSQC